MVTVPYTRRFNAGPGFDLGIDDLELFGIRDASEAHGFRAVRAGNHQKELAVLIHPEGFRKMRD